MKFGAFVVAVAVVGGVCVTLWPVQTIVVAVTTTAVVMIGRARRPHDEASEPTPVVPELVLLPAAVGLANPYLTAAATGAVALIALMRKRRQPPAPGMWMVPLALLGVATALVFREGYLSLAGTLGLVGILLLRTAGRTDTRSAVDSLMLGASLYLYLNIAAWLAGVQSPSLEVRVGGFESSSTLFGQRVFFPLARSINEAPIVASALLGFLAVAWLTRRGLRRAHWAGGAAALFVLVASNSRAPLVVAAVLSVGLLVAPTLSRRVLLPASLGALALPFYYTAALPLLRTLAGWAEAVPYITRDQGVEKLVGLNGRGVIWSSGNYWWDNIVHGSHTWIGYGQDGHVTSGVVSLYFDEIGGFLSDYTALSLHNSYLQQLFDGGLIGLALLVAAMVWTMIRFQRAGDTAAVVVLGTLYLTAVTEITLAPGSATIPFVLLLVLTAYAPLRSDDEAEVAEGGDDRLDDRLVISGQVGR